MQYEFNYHQQSQKKTSERVNVSHAIVPLSIHQVKTLKKQGEIEHQEFQNICLIGKIVSCALENNKFTIKISDGTGVIQLTSLSHGDKGKTSVVNESTADKIGKYFFVVITAKLRKENGDWTYFIDNLREITDHNEVTKHISDIILSHLERTR